VSGWLHEMMCLGMNSHGKLLPGEKVSFGNCTLHYCCYFLVVFIVGILVIVSQ